ncbi:MAG TPA: hypothetical protein VFV19_17655 [Candidatus Polarisedimenticolaceae bacterium]|nr:hypothetical protein [Candidatus Polarisedimenticolaceae bacterium]
MIAAALVVGSVALAQPTPTPNPDPNQDYSGLTMTKGQVVSSDSRSNTLVVKVDSKTAMGSTGSTGSNMGTIPSAEDMSFVVGPDTKILKGSKKSSLSEVASGDHVTVNYRTVGGKNMAVSIGIEPAA